jgi:Fic family protein
MSHEQLTWIWQQSDWPNFHWQNECLQPVLREVRLKQGILVGKTGVSYSEMTLETSMDNFLQNIIASFAIENEQLNAQSVRSSLAKRMGLEVKKPYPTSERSDGLATMIMDAIFNLDKALTLERLFQWHHWLFASEGSLVHEIQVGKLRGDDPMQVVSGRIDKPIVHFEAPPRHQLEKEVNHFIQWFNQSRHEPALDPILRAGICHFWFVTLHPFDDGNGRITRTLTDLALAQDDQQSIRLYTMSATILSKRNEYYTVLEASQRNSLDLTTWLIWFLKTLDESLQSAIDKVERTLMKTRFWQRHQHQIFSKEQMKVLNRLLDGGAKGFEQGITASKYQAVTKLSKATATRHLADLLAKGCIEKLPGGGRNTRYRVALRSVDISGFD